MPRHESHMRTGSKMAITYTTTQILKTMGHQVIACACIFMRGRVCVCVCDARVKTDDCSFPVFAALPYIVS
jgi:hypothetical protein